MVARTIIASLNLRHAHDDSLMRETVCLIEDNMAQVLIELWPEVGDGLTG